MSIGVYDAARWPFLEIPSLPPTCLHCGVLCMWVALMVQVDDEACCAASFSVGVAESILVCGVRLRCHGSDCGRL